MAKTAGTMVQIPGAGALELHRPSFGKQVLLNLSGLNEIPLHEGALKPLIEALEKIDKRTKEALYEPFSKKPKVRKELRGKSPKSEGPSTHIPQSSPGPGAGTVTISKGRNGMAGKRMIKRTVVQADQKEAEALSPQSVQQAWSAVDEAANALKDSLPQVADSLRQIVMPLLNRMRGASKKAGPMGDTSKSVQLAGGGYLNARVTNDADPKEDWQWEFEIVKDRMVAPLSGADVESLGFAAEQLLAQVRGSRGASKEALYDPAIQKGMTPVEQLAKPTPPKGHFDRLEPELRGEGPKTAQRMVIRKGTRRPLA